MCPVFLKKSKDKNTCGHFKTEKDDVALPNPRRCKIKIHAEICFHGFYTDKYEEISAKKIGPKVP